MPGRPLYLRIADHYRRLIQAGELRPGQFLPPQGQIMEEWECSITPVRMAIRELEHEGLIESLQGRGARVLPKTPRAGS